MPDIVSFDCYRTLIDFDLESATHEILGERLAEAGVDETRFNQDAQTIRFHAVVREYRPYREILRRTLHDVMLLHGLDYRQDDGDALVEAVKDFAPHPEVPDALRALRQGGYALCILSNSEDDLITYGVKALGVDFDYVVTAEQARAYKPLPQAFDHMLSVIGRTPDKVVHAAQGWEYDILPTRRYPGMRRVWVNRYGRRGSAYFGPYDEIRDLSALPPLLGL